MNTIPNIIVQLVHMEGPLKGKIQEFSAMEILIGRHPDCQVRFPKDVVTLSRKHARIVREGNRFKLIDQSTNGSFINSQRISEEYLKNGDVITFSENGPKVSFLSQVTDQPAPPQPQVPPPEQQIHQNQPAPPVQSQAQTPPQQPVNQAAQAPLQQPVPTPPPVQPAPSAPSTPSGPEVQNIKVPFAIQYGPALKSFQTLPITLGKGANSDFMINHPALNDQQVQIFFAQDQYWIKDLTGTNAVSINAMPISGQAALQPDMQISLSPQGPKFRFLGGGRLAEVEEPIPDQPQPDPQPESHQAQNKSGPGKQKSGSLFKKLFP